VSEPFHEKLYRYFREGRAATDAWNEAYLERNGLKPLLRRIEAGEIVGLGDFGGGSAAAEPQAVAAAAESGSAREVGDAPAGGDASTVTAVEAPAVELVASAVEEPPALPGPARATQRRPRPARALDAQLDLFPSKGAAR